MRLYLSMHDLPLARRWSWRRQAWGQSRRDVEVPAMRSVRPPRNQALSLRSLGSLLLLSVLGCATSVEEPNRQPENTSPPEKPAEKQELVRAPAPLPRPPSLED